MGETLPEKSNRSHLAQLAGHAHEAGWPFSVQAPAVSDRRIGTTDGAGSTPRVRVCSCRAAVRARVGVGACAVDVYGPPAPSSLAGCAPAVETHRRPNFPAPAGFPPVR